VTPENVQKAQKALGLALPQVTNMHKELYQQEVGERLEALSALDLAGA